MRILLSKQSKKTLFEELKKKYSCTTLKGLSLKTKIPFKTLEGWRYENKYIPEKFILENILENLEVIDKQEDNWGQLKP